MIDISASNAELIINKTGTKLDRRFNYYVMDGGSECDFTGSPIFTLAKYSHCCSGCGDDREYSSPYKGSGCEECGYQGRVRSYYLMPVVS